MTWRLPAEWEPQQSVWLVWPRDPLTWPDRVEKARAVFVQAMEAIAPQRVDLLVHPELKADAAKAVAHLDNVHVVAVEHQDSWIRDYGPLTLVSGRGSTKPLKFRFDAWGRKYDSLMADNAVMDRLEAAGVQATMEPVDFVLEGGAVETDGQGTFLATESVCRGRDQMPEEFEDILKEHLKAKKVIWLDEGIEGDDTDGHIDTIARFVAPGVVVAASAPADHPDHDALAEGIRRLRAAKDAKGRPLRVIELPMPEAQITDDGMPLPAGYANFLITEHAVLAPTFGCPEDEEVLKVLAELFPTRRIVSLDHRDLIWGMGGIHCLSMQVPSP